MEIKKNIALSDTGFVFDPSTGNSFSTNPIGLEIIQYLRQGLSTEKIQEQLIKSYEVDKNTVENDLDDFVAMLSKLKLTGNHEKD